MEENVRSIVPCLTLNLYHSALILDNEGGKGPL